VRDSDPAINYCQSGSRPYHGKFNVGSVEAATLWNNAKQHFSWLQSAAIEKLFESDENRRATGITLGGKIAKPKISITNLLTNYSRERQASLN